MRDILDRGKVLLEREYAREPRVAASLALALAQRYAELGENELEAEMLGRAESLAALGGAGDTLLLSRCQRALNLQKRDRAAEASALLAAIRPEVAAAAPVHAAACLQIEAEVELRADRFDSAVELGRRSASIMESLGTTTGLPYVEVL